MEQAIRYIVREQLEKALSEVKRTYLTSDADEIIGNFNRGRDFGVNNLLEVIPKLNKNFHLSDYWPKSDTFEKWIFESNDENYIVEITKKVLPEKTLWRLHYGKINKEEGQLAVASILNSSNRIPGYQKFIETFSSWT